MEGTSTAVPAFDERLAAIAHPEWLAPMVKVDTVSGPVPMDLWPHQRELIRAVLSRGQVIVLKARQLGVSWCLALIALWWALAHPGQLVLVVSIGEREAKSLMRKIHRLYDSLPAIVRRAYPLGADTTTQLEIQHSDGAATILSLPSSSTAGRGETVHLLLGDERPHWPHAEDQEASLLPAAGDTGTVALVGTANGMDGFYDRWMGAPDNGWYPIFVGALARPTRTPEWVEVKRANAGDKGPQEYPLSPEEAFLASGRCAFDRADLQALSAVSCTPSQWCGGFVREEKRIIPRADDRGDWWVWEWPQAGRSYVIGADASGGKADSDFSAAAVYDTTTWEQVAAFHGRVEPSELARELARAGFLFNRAILAPEANNHGQGVVALLREWAYPRLYRHEVMDRRTNRVTVHLGWHQTAQTRFTVVSSLQAGIREGTLGIRDRATVAEMNRFVLHEPTPGTAGSPRYAADAGAHDDRVMAHGIAAAVLALSPSASPPRESVPQPERVLDPITGYPVG